MSAPFQRLWNGSSASDILYVDRLPSPTGPLILVPGASFSCAEHTVADIVTSASLAVRSQQIEPDPCRRN